MQIDVIKRAVDLVPDVVPLLSKRTLDIIGFKGWVTINGNHVLIGEEDYEGDDISSGGGEYDRVSGIAEKLGWNKENIRILDVATDEPDTIAEYMPDSRLIYVYSDNISGMDDERLEGILSHEVTHDSLMQFEELDTENSRNINVDLDNREQTIKIGGMTDYSKQWWAKYETTSGLMKDKIYRMAIRETLCETARMRALLGTSANAHPKLVYWGNLLDRINGELK
jgi:hypothetical protein